MEWSRQRHTSRFTKHELQHMARQLSGKLLLKSEFPFQGDMVERLLEQKIVKAIPAITQKYFSYKCNRCQNDQRSKFAMMPCLTCEREYVYCRNCVVMGLTKRCDDIYIWTGPETNWPKHEQPCAWHGELTIYQQQAADKMVDTIVERNGRLLVWGVCGSGKTEMLFPSVEKALILGKRICIATPRSDVVRELYPRLKEAFPTIPIEALYGGSVHKDGKSQLIIGTTHQLHRFYQTFDVIIVDEIDAFPYHADVTLPRAVNRALKQNGTKLFLTATPRKKQKRLIVQGKLPHVFIPQRYHGFPLPVPQFKLCMFLKSEIRKHDLPIAFKRWIVARQAPHRQLLIFVSTVDLAHRLKESFMFTLKNTSVIRDSTELAVVHASDPEREEKVIQFRKKRLRVLVTTTILERGVTFPSIDVAVIDASHHVFDEAALVQIAGRAGRNAKDPTGEVVFFHDGKSNAMVQAVRSIHAMNRRGGFSS